MTSAQIKVTLDATTGAALAAHVLEARRALPPGARLTAAGVVRAILVQRLAGQMAVALALPDRDHQLLLQMRSASRRERDQAQVELLARWEGRIRRLARRARGRDILPQDLVSAGKMGLLEAAARWRLGTGWTGYAIAHVRKALQRTVRHAGVVSQSEHSLKRAARTGEGRKPKGWADCADPLHEAAGQDVDMGEALDLAALRHHLAALDPDVRAALLEHFTNGGGDPALVAAGLAALRETMR